jgi:hypothetical protein
MRGPRMRSVTGAGAGAVLLAWVLIGAVAGCGDPNPADSDAQVAGAWVLVVDEDGVIVQAENITVNGGRRQGDSVAGAAIVVDPVTATGSPVTITNHSGEELRLGAITASSPGSIEIVVASTGASDVVVDGVVDNELGLTSIYAAGAIRGGGAGVVRTNRLTLAAAAIGPEAERLAIELVRSPGLDTDLVATAVGDLVLDLTGHLRDLLSDTAEFSTGTLTAGGGVDLLLRSESSASQYLLERLVAGADIVMRAAAPGRRDPSVHVMATTDVLGTGHVDALTSGSVTIVEAAGDLRIGTIESTAGDVALSTTDAGASIADVNANDGTTPCVVGNRITLSADGGIGALTNFLELDSSTETIGAVEARATGGVFLNETQGDLRLDAVLSRMADVVLVTAGGSVLDAAGDETADVQAANIDLVVAGGGIGTDADAVEIYGAGIGQQQNTLEIEAAVPGAGRLVVESRDSVYLTEVSGALSVLEVTASLGGVRLAVNDSASPGESVSLLASGQTQLGTPIASGRVSGALAVEVAAGDNVSVPAATLIRSDLSVLVRGDALGTDRAGASISIVGDLQAPTVEIDGGNYIDHVELGNPGGINAGGTTHVRAGQADDRLYVRAIAGPTTLHGDAGADRYFIASNATQALIGNGDATPPLTLMSGTLPSFSGLVIEAGANGNGGVPDSAYLSTDASTASVTGVLGTGAVSGLGMEAPITYVATNQIVVWIELGGGDDTMTVTDPSPNLARIYGGPGSDVITGCSLPSCIVDPD